MNEERYTNKEWYVRDMTTTKEIRDEDGGHIAEIWNLPSDDMSHDEFDANAHLVAAAPDLYEALENVIRYVPFQTTRCKGDKCREPWCESCWGEEFAEEALGKAQTELSEARNALSKARGEKQ